MRAANVGENFLKLKPALPAIGGSGCRCARDQRSRIQRRRIVDVDEHDWLGSAADRFHRGRQTRELKTRLGDGLRREHEIIGIGNRFGVA
jgi:hypothetical protein